MYLRELQDGRICSMTKLLSLWLQFSSTLSSVKDQFFNQSFGGFFCCCCCYFFFFFRIWKKKFQRKQPKLILIISKPTLWQDNARIWIHPTSYKAKSRNSSDFPTRRVVKWQLDVRLWIHKWQKKQKKQLKTHSVNLTHTIVTHTSFHRFNLSTEVTFLDRRSIFSCLNLCCHQQFYSRMSSFVDLKSNHHFRFFFLWKSWQPPLPSHVDLRHGTVIRHCQAHVGSLYGLFLSFFFFLSLQTGLKCSIIKRILEGVKFPMFIHCRWWWMACLRRVSCVNQSGWLIRSADSQPQGDGYSNPWKYAETVKTPWPHE